MMEAPKELAYMLCNECLARGESKDWDVMLDDFCERCQAKLMQKLLEMTDDLE